MIFSFQKRIGSDKDHTWQDHKLPEFKNGRGRWEDNFKELTDLLKLAGQKGVYRVWISDYGNPDAHTFEIQEYFAYRVVSIPPKPA